MTEEINYKDYLFDEEEDQELELEKELSLKIEGSDLSYYGVQLTEEEKWLNVKQCEIVSAIFYTIVTLLQLEDFEFCNQGSYFYISEKVSEDEKHILEKSSPRLSRKKLLLLNEYQLSKVFTSFFLDRSTWSQEVGLSIKLSDGNGNWLI